MVFPDGEHLSYDYNAGGLPERVRGSYKGAPYAYVTLIGYDEYEQRVRVELGNGAVSDYSYDPRLRRLEGLQTQSQGVRFQNLDYEYDKVGNITRLLNIDVDTSEGGMGGEVSQRFGYDSLYRLSFATGTYQGAEGSVENYRLDMEYDAIHNITRKNQRHTVGSLEGDSTKHATTYDWSYRYDAQGSANAGSGRGNQPHAPTHIGELDGSGDILGRTFSYDANGNQLGWSNDKNATRRTITWDDENRIQAIDDKGKTSTYGYDDQGERVIKQASQNLTVYVNQYFTERNGTIGSKHIFVGNTRMVTKVTGGTNFIRSYDGVTDAKTPPGQAKKSEPVPSEPTQSEPQPDTTAADTAGTNNGNAYGRDKDKPAKAGNKDKSKAKKAGAATMTAGLTGLMNRAERANEVAQNTCKNKHLREQYCDEDGNGLPDSQEGDEGDTGGGTGDPDEGTLPEDEVIQIGSNGEQLFYYHSDHLGSTGYVTRENGEVHEHIQYFPFGETWVQQGGNTEKSPYLFTSKELDEETGLYYYGARYYDPRTSVWQSADPILDDYLNGERGSGGIYNPVNLGLYSYTHQNPVRLVDPDGNSPRRPGGNGIPENVKANLGLRLGANGYYTPTPSARVQTTSAEKQLLPTEGKVAPYNVLQKAGAKGDNITPHHIPSANHMAKHGVKKEDGIAINMEQPAKGGRHRQTFTYGSQADAKMSPRDALAAGIKDARKIYQREGLYGPEIRKSLQEVSKQNKIKYLEIFQKVEQ